MNAPNTINMTVELCQEDRARLDRILEALTAKGHSCNCAEAPKAATEPAAPAKEELPVEVYTPEEESPAEAKIEAPAEVPADTRYKPSHEEVQRKVVTLIKAGKKVQARGIINAYADSISGIPEDKLADVWEKLGDLDA